MRNTQNLTRCGLFTALIAAGAFIKIPIPVVPFTLQFLFTNLAGLILGRKYGTISVVVYMVLGLMGFPIFAEGGGFSYILKPSFGYMIGFCAGTFVTGMIAERLRRRSVPSYFAAGFIGLLLVYAVGMLYYYLICNYVIDTPIAFWPLMLYCFILAVPGDICLCVMSAVLMKRIQPILHRMPIQPTEE